MSNMANYEAALRRAETTKRRQQEAMEATEGQISMLEKLIENEEKSSRANEPRLPLGETEKTPKK